MLENSIFFCHLIRICRYFAIAKYRRYSKEPPSANRCFSVLQFLLIFARVPRRVCSAFLRRFYDLQHLQFQTRRKNLKMIQNRFYELYLLHLSLAWPSTLRYTGGKKESIRLLDFAAIFNFFLSGRMPRVFIWDC